MMLATSLRSRFSRFTRTTAVSATAGSMATAAGAGLLRVRFFSALVDSEWVRAAQESGKPKLLLLDCNHPAAFPRGHIPQAVPFVLASSSFKDPTPNATGVIGKDLFKSIVEKMKVPQDATLVFYDDQMSLTSSRMWWVFRHFGFPEGQLKVLDGGLKQWEADKNEVATGEYDATDADDSVALWSDVKETQALVGLEAVQEGIADPDTQFVDARSAGEFWGEDANGNARTGHVPGAINFNWMDGVDFAFNGKFKPESQMDEMLLEVHHLDKSKPVIAYCQRGIRAAHAAFALEQVAGFKNVKIYEDSMLQYLNRDDSEVEKPELPLKPSRL